MENLWIVGAGNMGQEYVKVLKSLPVDFSVIGRGYKSANDLKEKYDISVVCGGVKKAIEETKNNIPTRAIVCSTIDTLAECTIELFNAGIKYILLEKPGGLNLQEISEIKKSAEKNDAEVYIAYNRRFYSSVIEAQKIIEEDGGVTSFQFDFTEWSHYIEPLNISSEIKQSWLLCNSSHVLDLAFFLGGKPKEIKGFSAGALSWHPRASVFCGAGYTTNEIPFSYHANWESAGRWSVEICTSKRKLILRPLEELHEILRGSVAIQKRDVDNSLDVKFKPGLFLQCEAFLNNDFERFISISDFVEMVKLYEDL